MNFIVDDIGKVAQAVKEAFSLFDQTFDPTFDNSQLPLYMYGHRVELAARLALKDKDVLQKRIKYPLIALRLDTVETIEGNMVKFDLNLALINKTEKGYNAEQRYTNVFKPILYPLYELFLVELKKSGLFTWPGFQARPPHVKVDRLYWGTAGTEGNVANLFGDPVDAIEILNLKINQTVKC